MRMELISALTGDEVDIWCPPTNRAWMTQALRRMESEAISALQETLPEIVAFLARDIPGELVELQISWEARTPEQQAQTAESYAELVKLLNEELALQEEVAAAPREFLDGLRRAYRELVRSCQEYESALQEIVITQAELTRLGTYRPLDPDSRTWREERFWATTSQAARAYGCNRSYIKKRAPELASAGDAYKHADGRWRLRYHAIRDLGAER